MLAAQRRVELLLTPKEVVGTCLVTEDDRGRPPFAGLETKLSPETARRAMMSDVFLKFMMWMALHVFAIVNCEPFL